MRDDLPDLFEAAAKSVNPGFVMDEAAKGQVQKLQREAIHGIQQMDRFAKRDATRYVNEVYKVGQEKVERYAVTKGIKGIQFSNGAKWTIGNYSDMLLTSNASRTFNQGVLTGLRAAGVDVVEVSDGADCGWTFHGDSEQADGKLVTLEEAESHLLAHPHCQRRFTGRPDLDGTDADKKLSTVAKAAIAASAVGAGIAVAGLYASTSQGRTAAFLRNAYKQNPRFVSYEYALRTMQTQLKQAANLKPRQLYDFVSGLPIVETDEQLAYYFNQAKRQVEHMAKADLRTLSEIVQQSEVAFIRGQEIPAYIRKALLIGEDAPRKVVGGAFQEYAEYTQFRFKYMDQNFLGSLGNFIDMQNRAQDAFWRWATPVGPSWSKVSYPKIGAKRYGRFTIMDPDGAVKYTRTAGARGSINRLTFNRNGLLRAGFRMDPETGRITPDIRIVSKALPIRIYTNPTVSKRTGKIISASIDVVFLTPTPVNFKAKFYASFRSLSVGQTASGGVNWRDLLSVRTGDIRRMKRLDPEFFKIVSVGAETRIRGTRTGYGRVGPFDFPATFSIPWEEAVALWQLTNVYLKLQLEELGGIIKSKMLGSFGGVDWPMFGLSQAELEAMDRTKAQQALQALIAEINRLLGEQP